MCLNTFMGRKVRFLTLTLYGLVNFLPSAWGRRRTYEVLQKVRVELCDPAHINYFSP